MSDALNIQAWKRMSTELKNLKATEAALRREICELMIQNNEMVNGRVTVKDQIGGYAVKAIQTLSYTVDTAALGVIWDGLSSTERDSIVMKPSLALAKYKALPEDSLIHEAVISRLAMPTLQAELEGE